MLDTLARKYGLEKEVIQAVSQVESGGRSGFQRSGKLTVLFEAHRFFALLKKAGLDAEALAKKHPDLISKVWNRALYRGGDAENQRLERAVAINALAWQAASYGKFQILGEHYKNLGFKTAEAYVDYLKDDPDHHLELFFRFVALPSNAAMLKALQKKDWSTFAKLYNGPGYAANQYDKRMETNYKTLIAQKKG